MFGPKGRLQNLKTGKRVKSCIKVGGGQFRIIISNCQERMTYPQGGRGGQLHSLHKNSGNNVNRHKRGGKTEADPKNS